MANLQYYDIILKPIITEKAMGMLADKKYCLYILMLIKFKLKKLSKKCSMALKSLLLIL